MELLEKINIIINYISKKDSIFRLNTFAIYINVG